MNIHSDLLTNNDEGKEDGSCLAYKVKKRLCKRVNAMVYRYENCCIVGLALTSNSGRRSNGIFKRECRNFKSNAQMVETSRIEPYAQRVCPIERIEQVKGRRVGLV